MSYMTEEQARKRWCPFARVVEVDDDANVIEGFAVGNRSTMNTGHPKARCIASDCMAFRWRGVEKGGVPSGGSRGYCGLAGKPEGGES